MLLQRLNLLAQAGFTIIDGDKLVLDKVIALSYRDLSKRARQEHHIFLRADPQKPIFLDYSFDKWESAGQFNIQKMVGGSTKTYLSLHFPEERELIGYTLFSNCAECPFMKEFDRDGQTFRFNSKNRLFTPIIP